MALINCKNCRKEISENESVCHECGTKINWFIQDKIKGIIGWILIPYIKIPKVLYKKWEDKHGKGMRILGAISAGMLFFPIWVIIVVTIFGTHDKNQTSNVNAKMDNSKVIATTTVKSTIPPTPTIKPTTPPTPSSTQTINPRTKFLEWVHTQFSIWDGSCYELVKLLKENMNDADSFEHVETRYSIGDYKVIVYMKYRGNNAFGGKVLNVIKGELDYKANTVKIVSDK